MKDELVSRKTAILAKEKGFIPHVDSHPFYYYRDEPWNIEEEEIKNSNDIFVSDYIHREETEYSAPTQTALSRWLREVHNLHVEAYRTLDMQTGLKYGCQVEHWDERHETSISNDYSATYEEAVEG